MSKTLLYNLILTIVAIVVFIFIGASVYDAFTRNPVNRTAVDATGASTVSGQIEAATPDATQPDQPAAAGVPATETAPAEQDKQQADAAYNQTNDPSQASAATSASGSASDSATVDSTPSDSAADTAGAANSQPAAPAPSRATPASPESVNNAGVTGSAPADNSNQPGGSAGSSTPATRSNPDLRAVIPPVPTAPPRAEGVPPRAQSDQDMYNATDSGADSGNISESFPAPVSNFPAPAGSAGDSNGNNQSNNQPGSDSAFPAPGNTQGGNSDEQRRLEELRRQKEQLRRDLGF